MGTLVIASTLSACSNNNTSDNTQSSSARGISAEITDTNAEETTAPEAQYDTNAPSRECAANRHQMLFVMDNGDYIYSANKDGDNVPVEVYIRDDRKGRTEELDLPEYSELLYSAEDKLYYYSPDDGLCVYDDGKSTPLNSETKYTDVIPPRDTFFFTDDAIYFAVSGDNGTEIKSMDYSGKLSDKVYTSDFRNVRIVGFYKNDLICSYNIGTNGYICIFSSENSSTELKTGDSPYIIGDKVYFIDFNSLCCIPLEGGEKEKVSDERCTDFCFYEDKLVFTDSISVFSAEPDGKSNVLLEANDLTNCNYISGLGITDGKLYICGGSGSFWKSIAETDENGKIVEEISAGVDR